MGSFNRESRTIIKIGVENKIPEFMIYWYYCPYAKRFRILLNGRFQASAIMSQTRDDIINHLIKTHG